MQCPARGNRQCPTAEREQLAAFQVKVREQHLAYWEQRRKKRISFQKKQREWAASYLKNGRDWAAAYKEDWRIWEWYQGVLARLKRLEDALCPPVKGTGSSKRKRRPACFHPAHQYTSLAAMLSSGPKEP